MVRAILEGRKTQTRRVIKAQPYHKTRSRGQHVWFWERSKSDLREFIDWDSDTSEEIMRRGMPEMCPYGVRGDRLWLREKVGHTASVHGACVIWYAADGSVHHTLATDGGEGDLCGVGPRAKKMEVMPVTKWTPSIHMPRWACRITLEVVSVRVERLQEISEADAEAEGCDPALPVADKRWVCGYRRLWDHINGPGSWAANPWVWVVEFKRVSPGGAA